jgi:hypothetical protein
VHLEELIGGMSSGRVAVTMIAFSRLLQERISIGGSESAACRC